MLMITTCPFCKYRLQAPEQLAGTRFQCPKCRKFLTLPAAGTAAAAAEKTTVVAKITYGLGVAALAAGVLAFLVSPFTGATAFAREVGWIGLLLGCCATGIAFFRDDCGVAFPIAGMLTSALALTLVILGIGANPLPGSWAPGATATAPEDGKGPGGGRKNRGRKGKQADAQPPAPPMPAQ
jgi:hypothetical protein